MSGQPYNSQPIVLASASKVRRRLLQAAGIELEIVPANIDEASIREALLAGGNDVDPGDTAEVLARTKADDVGQRMAGRLIVAGDQILAFDGRIFEKPADHNEARANLLALSGRSHALHSAVVLASDGEIVWAHIDSVQVKFRDLSPEFVGRYMARAGDGVLSSVGCYELEGLGVHLIEHIEGDYFSVLGLPLYALLAELRKLGAIES